MVTIEAEENTLESCIESTNQYFQNKYGSKFELNFAGANEYIATVETSEGEIDFEVNFEKDGLISIEQY